MKTKTLRQSVLLKASPHEVYEALMDSKKHAEFTHSSAIISREVGGAFSAFDGWASGTTLELSPDKRIVQKWRATDWPQGHFSTVTFELQTQGSETRLDFTQSDIPEDLYAELETGWVEYYWDNLVTYFS
ncbi:MAG: SRPBCC family protein [Halobacteriota archaeon]